LAQLTINLGLARKSGLSVDLRLFDCGFMPGY
jgi:hypothetical protein